MPSRYADLSLELQGEVMRVYEPMEREEFQDWGLGHCHVQRLSTKDPL